jgi:hypothetical protein
MKRATIALVIVLIAGCRSLPWKNEPVGSEVNFAFVLENNLVRMQTAEINGFRGNYVFGSATPRTVIDTRAAGMMGNVAGYDLQVSEKQTIHINPLVTDLGAADAIIGADLIGDKAVTVDYRLGMVTYQKLGIFPGMMKLYRFNGPPTIKVTVDGSEIDAIVDTTSPDTLTLPGGGARRNAHVLVAGSDFGTIDVGAADIPVARIGNRLLGSFLVTIDYGKGVVGMFRDTRMK